MDSVTAFSCECGYRIPRVRAWPVRCRCGRVAPGPLEAADQMPPPMPARRERRENPQWLEERLRICRNQCPNYRFEGDRCGIQVDKGRPGRLDYMVIYPVPEGTCPAPEPLWGPVEPSIMPGMVAGGRGLGHAERAGARP